MKQIFDPYVLWPFDKKVISQFVTRDYTVILPSKPALEYKPLLKLLWSDIESFKMKSEEEEIRPHIYILQFCWGH